MVGQGVEDDEDAEEFNDQYDDFYGQVNSGLGAEDEQEDYVDQQRG